MWWALHVSDRLPDGWDAREFETAVRNVVARDGRATTVELLAWRTEEAVDRHLVYDLALAWARIEDLNHLRWALLVVYRHPQDSAKWHLAKVTHSPSPVKYFNGQPSNADIYRFDDGVFMHPVFKPATDGFRTLNSRVRCRTWYRCVGELPTRFFP
jgi:hypothetical protein